jgi:CrcB protein
MCFALAGSAGTIARYLIQLLAAQLLGKQYPWGTLIVNAVGCFLFGVVWALEQDRELIGDETRVIFLVGFMGAFTTFSSFAFETVLLAQKPGLSVAALNLIAHNLLGIGAVLSGITVVRQF